MFEKGNIEHKKSLTQFAAVIAPHVPSPAGVAVVAPAVVVGGVVALVVAVAVPLPVHAGVGVLVAAAVLVGFGTGWEKDSGIS